MNFWDTFWPGLWSNGIATLIGVGAGVPIALWIDRTFRAHRRAAQAAEDSARMSLLVEALQATLEANATALRELLESVRAREVPLLVSFDVAVWDAVRTDAVRLLDDPKLHVGLATYFEDLAGVARLQRELIDTKIGVGSTFTNAEKIRNQLFDVIDDATGRLLDESDRLVSDVQRAAKSSEASLSSRAR